MDNHKKEFIQKYIDLLQEELDSFSQDYSDESSVFDVIVEIKGVFAADFPDLDANLSFNNGSATRDAKIVLGLLNKALIEDSSSEFSNSNQSDFPDILNQLKIEVGSFKSTALTWDKKGNICNYFEQLEQALNNDNIKSIKFCLRLIDEWYNQTIDRIVNAQLCPHKNEHKNNAAKIKLFLDKVSQIPDNYIVQKEDNSKKGLSNNPIIFISHSSSDKKYGDALRNFIVGLGVKDNQLIYTSHELNGIPMDKNIYEYLRENFDNKVFMIILWSNTYLESPACLNEMGAAWVTQSDYTNVYVPDFEFGNPKYHQCAVDTRKMGPVLKNDGHCKTKMIELKDKILKMFNLEIDEKHLMVLLDVFMKEIA